jgi:hypothetical protein
MAEREVKPVEPEDPMALVGVALERGPDEQALAEMALCIVEEYARIGWSPDRIVRLFRSPFYRGPHRILREKGEDYVCGLIEKVTGMRPQIHLPDGGRP